LINYQGYLTASNGTSLDTTVAMTFRIYGMANGGDMLWMETHPSVVVESGLFNAALGSITPLNDLFNANRWLEIQVGSDLEMIPRQPIVSVAHAYRVGTVDCASGGTISGKLNVGQNNSNAGTFAMVAGENNRARGDYSVVAGGGGPSEADSNTAQVSYSVVSGGQSNTSDGNNATVSGGYDNTASAAYATVSGGLVNTAGDRAATVSGGEGNTASESYATVSGGEGNTAVGAYATVSGGGSNQAFGDWTTIGGGSVNLSVGEGATVGGGVNNAASGEKSTVPGGEGNTASDSYATVSGGFNNTASGLVSTVSGGFDNTASGLVSTVAGGSSNQAGGEYSFAAGLRANASGDGVFAWADATGADFGIGSANTFNARASGGVRFWTTADISENIGARLPAGGSLWVAISDSTKKRNIRLVDTKVMLDKVSQMPIKQWSYKSQYPSIEHIGPMAQDFWNLFHIGDDSLTISTLDPSGVALAAIQELAKRNAELEARVKLLEEALLQLGLNKSTESR